MMINKL